MIMWSIWQGLRKGAYGFWDDVGECEGRVFQVISPFS